MKLLTRVGHIFDRTNDVLAAFAGALIIFMMLSVSTTVVTRLFFRALATGEVGQVNEWGLVYITFLATAWLLREEGHVKMTIVLDGLSPRNQVRLNVITSILCAVGCLIIACYGAKVTLELFQVGYATWGVLTVPKFIILAVIPVGCFLLFIQFLRRAYRYLGSQRGVIK